MPGPEASLLLFARLTDAQWVDVESRQGTFCRAVEPVPGGGPDVWIETALPSARAMRPVRAARSTWRRRARTSSPGTTSEGSNGGRYRRSSCRRTARAGTTTGSRGM
ncbi:hypothetical protein QRN89_28590 [Streptomyces chengbuensis]|nr:hypothetical protein [Streptomyces sp. HUAS CB01]WJY53424.1 hypothetical protein QRN89_28590 [Streptomyces sp. HUAS CB01]